MPDNDTLDTPPAATQFQPASGLGGASFDPATGGEGDGSRVDQARQLLRDNTAKLQSQAGDKARDLAEQGKARATEALGQLSKMIEDAAGTVDEKLGQQYGDYARQAVGTVNGLSDRINGADIDQIMADVRDFVRKSPGVAVGVSAAIGFALARLVQSGIDERPI